jgi:hypothetical protein
MFVLMLMCVAMFVFMMMTHGRLLFYKLSGVMKKMVATGVFPEFSFNTDAINQIGSIVNR